MTDIEVTHIYDGKTVEAKDISIKSKRASAIVHELVDIGKDKKGNIELIFTNSEVLGLMSENSLTHMKFIIPKNKVKKFASYLSGQAEVDQLKKRVANLEVLMGTAVSDIEDLEPDEEEPE